MAHVRDDRPLDPNFNAFVREPGHIEFASTLGLGRYDQKSIQRSDIEIA
jgi:hypothetical protein